MYCKQCGREVGPTDGGKFCLWCGADFKEFPPVSLITIGTSKTATSPTPAEVGAKPKNASTGLPVKIIQAGSIFAIIIPIWGFVLGYLVISGLPPIECGLGVAALVYLSSFITGKVIGWMVK